MITINTITKIAFLLYYGILLVRYFFFEIQPSNFDLLIVIVLIHAINDTNEK
jgi:hypothetical protein